ncbi:hypothetical protein [Actinomycetospora sp.]|uniref:hypothetical protein n=1 Tax=Actinomycetospora sp. TaxID=1872135 RepID=UPI002F407207
MREMIRVRGADHELRVQVLDGRAYVAIVAADGSEDAEAWSRAVSLPARRLHALLRAAWADDQYGAVGPLDPPLRPSDEPPDGPEPEEDPYRQERLRFGWRDDWPDGTWSDGALVPFPGTASYPPVPYPAVPYPRAVPWPPPSWRDRPARSGLPWSVEDDAALREAWIAAAPDTDRAALMGELAARFERTTGGVLNRLHHVGCEPHRPGAARYTPLRGTPAVP